MTASLSRARLDRMHDAMLRHVESGRVPGLVTLVARRDEVHVDAIGNRRLTTHVRQKRETVVIRIKLTSVMVDDQAKAQKFYTEVLGFVTKRDIPMGAARWLTVVSPAEPEGTELLLEPNSGVEEAPGFQKALLDSGIPITAFAVDDIEAEYDRLKALGVEFRGPPSKPDVGPSAVVLNDTCGNLIQLFQA